MVNTVRLQFWADSFHEGFWACDEIGKHFSVLSIVYEKGFIPVFRFALKEGLELEVMVLGSYKNWSPLPQPIAELIDWGKPDLIVFDPVSNSILMAVEETAAVPTGNQALQRCERMYGSLRRKIPFWYLLGEFGTHIDGGTRRDSIWPTVLGIKLSCAYKTPCMVLHYSDLAHPEDYAFGTGLASLFLALAIKIKIFFGIEKNAAFYPVLEEQYRHMFNFINSQWRNVVDFLPQEQLLQDPTIPQVIAKFVSGSDPEASVPDLFAWPNTPALPKEIYQNISPGGWIKDDQFVRGLEVLVEKKVAYNLSSNAGSKPQKTQDVSGWISEQKNILQRQNNGNYPFEIDIKDFPKSASGLLHVTTAKNVLYLIDSSEDAAKTLITAFPRLKKFSFPENGSAFVYISNSLKPGRIFGDPFTGQLSAFANIFGRDIRGKNIRLRIAYYPHQVHAQLFDKTNNFRMNKGITIMRELLDFAVFHGGVVVNMQNGQIV